MIDIRKNCKYRHDNGNCLKVGGFCLAVDDEHCEMVLAIEALKEQEREHGRWIDGNEKCPICGESKFKDLDADIWADWKPSFCPNCGANMRGEQR